MPDADLITAQVLDDGASHSYYSPFINAVLGTDVDALEQSGTQRFGKLLAINLIGLHYILILGRRYIGRMDDHAINATLG